MANKKFYAVRKGRTPGIYQTWSECQAEVTGFKGAEFKSFLTLQEAELFLTKECVKEEEVKLGENSIVVYVDGSYNGGDEFAYGMIVLTKSEELQFNGKIEDKEMAAMRNVAGEITGAMEAMKYALEHKITKIYLHYDYFGIEKWCTGEWKTNKNGTKAYKEYYDSIKEYVEVIFVKVKGHSNNKYNDLADYLAKKALGIEK